MKALLAPIAALCAWTALPGAVQAAGPKAGANSAAKPVDPGWPREIAKGGIKLSVYQPEIDEWKDFRELKARCAFVMTVKDGKPVVGVAELGGATTTDAESRTVLIKDLKITAARFPSLAEAEVAPAEALLKKTFPGRSLTVELDRLAAGAERRKAARPLKLRMEAPEIFTSTEPSIVLMVEGKPVLAPIQGAGLQFVVNTNWDLFLDKASGAYFVLAEKTWLTAPALNGAWTLATQLPAGFAKLPQTAQWEHVRKVVPPKIKPGMEIPAVFYSEKPAELILFDGSPTWQEVENTRLLWAKNTDSWVFDNDADSNLYFLVSGRWFRSPKWTGPWTYAGADLPADFKNIPPNSPCADVLASVPGTPEAEDAILLAQVPHEAVINKKEAEAKARVAYDGEPQFALIEGSQMAYATNAGADVIQFDGKYYLCLDAVWFVSDSASGPWTVCEEVPEAIYTIGPEYPVHHCTYVEVYPGGGDYCVCSYTDGYYDAYIADCGTLVWGTGYYYPPFVVWGGAVPIYCPWPRTYGFAAAYNPWTGGYAAGGKIYGPYATAGRAAWYNPATGSYRRASQIEGPYGSRTAAAGCNPRADTSWATRQGSNGFAQWGTSAVRRGDDWVRAGHIATEDGGVARWSGSEGGGKAWKTDDHSGGAARHDGNVYAGRDGNVYRRDESGNWSKWDNGDWGSVAARDNLQEAHARYDNRGTSAFDNRAGPVFDNRPHIAGNANLPGAAQGGPQIIPHPAANLRPGAGGGGQQQITHDNIGSRASAHTAAQQPAPEVLQQLNRESFNRQRSDFRSQQQQQVTRQPAYQPQRQQAQRAPASRPSPSSSSRSFSRPSGGGGARGGGGGTRRR